MAKNPRQELIRAHYERRVVPGRDSYDVLDWGSREAQLARFHVLVDLLIQHDLAGTETATCQLLDVGCGLTDLCDLLDRLGLEVAYTGADIVSAILAEARRRHPERNLVQADIFQREPFAARTFDVVFCSGTFNLEVGNNETFAQHALLTMLPLVRDCLVANFLHTRTPRKYEHCHYYDPQALMSGVRDRAVKIDVIDNYLENDFTLVLWRQNPAVARRRF